MCVYMEGEMLCKQLFYFQQIVGGLIGHGQLFQKMVPSENSLLQQDLGYLHFSTPILLKQFDGGDLFGNLEKTALIVFV